MTLKTYPTPAAFKQALEQRLRNISGTGAGLSRERQLLVFDRFLARIVHDLGDAVTLKGGLVLELRLARARSTADVDLRLMGSPERLLARLQLLGRTDLNDHLTFEVSPDPQHPEIQGEAVKYDGRRFRAECRLAGKLYGHPFGVDVAFGDPLFGAPETMTAKDSLDFIEVPPPTIQIYPVETHLAEKLHAYSIPRHRPNTRVKDLPDIALLASTGELKATRCRSAFQQTFEFRNSHPLPASLAAPNQAWAGPYAKMAKTDGLSWQTLEEVTKAAQLFMDPLLSNAPIETWNPETWAWHSQ